MRIFKSNSFLLLSTDIKSSSLLFYGNEYSFIAKYFIRLWLIHHSGFTHIRGQLPQHLWFPLQSLSVVHWAIQIPIPSDGFGHEPGFSVVFVGSITGFVDREQQTAYASLGAIIHSWVEGQSCRLGPRPQK